MAEFNLKNFRSMLKLQEGDGLWVFGYGSLLWSPCFKYEQAQVAHALGWQRSFSLYSVNYRGTPEQPGLVLGLDRGGSCQGIAFEIKPENVDDALARLWAREMDDDRCYDPICLPVKLSGDHRQVNALTFVVHQGNEMHCPDLPVEKSADIISSARGRNGSNVEYLEKTVKSLQQSGIRDPQMEELLARVQERLLH
jgi:cation transport protein ChaC